MVCMCGTLRGAVAGFSEATFSGWRLPQPWIQTRLRPSAAYSTRDIGRRS